MSRFLSESRITWIIEFDVLYFCCEVQRYPFGLISFCLNQDLPNQRYECHLGIPRDFRIFRIRLVNIRIHVDVDAFG